MNLTRVPKLMALQITDSLWNLLQNPYQVDSLKRVIHSGTKNLPASYTYTTGHLF